MSDPTIDNHLINAFLTRTVQMGGVPALNILTMRVYMTYLQYSVKFDSLQKSAAIKKGWNTDVWMIWNFDGEKGAL